MRTGLKKILQRFSSCRWELAFLKESPDEIVHGHKPHFVYIENPFKEYWFADPFILSIQGQFVNVLAETMPRKDESKATISQLDIDWQKKAIISMEKILEDEWHLSFPCILRKDGDIYVCPESAEAEKLYIYKLTQDKDGIHHLEKIKSICDETVWDSDISSLFGAPRMFTAKRDNYHLDIYSWDESLEKFVYDQSVSSRRQNMRMAGSLFKVGDDVFCPQQDSGYTYGNAVEINKIELVDGVFKLVSRVVIRPPRRFMIDGVHTFNSYEGLVVVDILRQEHLVGFVLRILVAIKYKYGILLR